MKKVLSVLFAIIILCMCIIPSYAANPKISVKTVSSASVGETITVSVNLSANSNLGGIEFMVKYDTSAFQYVSGSAKTGNVFSEAIINSDVVGKLHYGGYTTTTVNSSGTFMSFKLKVLKVNGKITVSVRDAFNGEEKDITSLVSVSGTTVKCSHANMKWDILKKATCTEKGEKKGTCICGYTTTDIIPKSEHAYGKWTIEKEATETEKGLKWAKCSVCGDKKEQVIPLITTTTTETTTFVENTTESTTNEPTTVPTPQIVEKTSTAEIVAKTVAVVLGVEALGLIVFLISKKKKENK